MKFFHTRCKTLYGFTPSSFLCLILEKLYNLALMRLLKILKKITIEEAESLIEATVHWLRHTGISEDVKRRPWEHVRDDAGHSSRATTDKYIDVELRERHRSAKNKPILSDA